MRKTKDIKKNLNEPLKTKSQLSNGSVELLVVKTGAKHRTSFMIGSIKK